MKLKAFGVMRVLEELDLAYGPDVKFSELLSPEKFEEVEEVINKIIEDMRNKDVATVHVYLVGEKSAAMEWFGTLAAIYKGLDRLEKEGKKVRYVDWFVA